MGPETTKLFILSVRLKRTGSIVISIRRRGFRSGGSRSPRHSNLSIPKNRLERHLPAFCRASNRGHGRFLAKADIPCCPAHNAGFGGKADMSLGVSHCLFLPKTYITALQPVSMC